MATITDAVVRLQPSNQVLRSDCFGNNAAIECPNCLQYPILLIARPDQHGASQSNPGVCRHCGKQYYIVDDLASGQQLEIVNVRAV